MTQWMKYIKFCTLFIAAISLYYLVNCDVNVEIPDSVQVEYDVGPREQISSETASADFKNGRSSKFERPNEAHGLSETKYTNSKKKDKLPSNADDDINSNINQRSEKVLQKNIRTFEIGPKEKNEVNKELGNPSQTILAELSEINKKTRETKEDHNEVNKFIKAEDQIEHIIEKQSDQENDSNTNNDEKEFHETEEYDDKEFQEIEEYDDIHVVENVESDFTGPRLPDCSDKIIKRDSVLIVSTIDGHITGINHMTGEVIWSHNTNSEGDPLLSSSMSKLEISSRGEWVRLIPSLDGGIYRFDGEHVEALPVTADTFLHSSFKFSDDTIFSGGKFLEILGIHPHTGEIKYTCDKNGCPGNPTAGDNRPTLVVRRVSYTVRAIDPSAGMERWNFSVGQHEINLSTGGCESLIRGLDPDSLPRLHFVLPEGNIVAMNTKSEVIWRQKLPSPILSAWSLINEELEQINLFSSTSIPALVPDEHSDNDAVDGTREPALYVGIHQGQLYVQENRNIHKNFGSVVQQFINTNTGEHGFPKVQWQPYLATALSRTPVIHHGAKNHPLLLDYDKKQQTNELVVRHNYDYPFDNGYYLYGEDYLLLNESDHWISAEDEISYIPESIGQQIYDYLYRRLSFWNVIFAISIILFFNILLVRRLVANSLRNTQRRMYNVVIVLVAYILHNIVRENAQIMLIIQRLGLNIIPLPPAQAPPPPSPAALPSEREDEEQSSLSVETQRQDSSFSSRYLTDFVPISRLGKGGFGVVFHAKNKLDENEYAVKRIVLPSKESSAERVKREARALAKLNHTNIVRYYNSWLETPPVGWEEDLFGKRSETLSLTQEENFSKQPFSSEINDPDLKEVLPIRKKDHSLSAIINKLAYNSEFCINPEGPTKNLESSLCDDNDGADVSSSSEGESGDDQDLQCDEQEHSSKSCDDSFCIEFEDIDLSEDKRTQESTGSRIIENGYSKLASKTRESSHSDSNVFINETDSIHEDSISVLSRTKESLEAAPQDSTCPNSPLEAKTVSSQTKESSESAPKDSTCPDSPLEAKTVSSQTKEASESAPKNSTCSNPPLDAKTLWKNKRQKHSSLCDSSDRKPQSRQRFNTHTGLTDGNDRPSLKLQDFYENDRPSSLKLQDFYENDRPSSLKLQDFYESNAYKDQVKDLNKCQLSPSPRTYLYIQMELCKRDSLKQWLLSNKTRDTTWVFSIFNDIVHAVEYVHDRSLMHRDLKPSNIFFSLDGEVKIGDFGLVTTIEDEDNALTPMVENSTSGPSVLGEKQKTLNVGTTLYMSPEQFSVSGQSYTFKVDIFSLGLIFFEMLVPFSTEMERIDVMSKAREKEFPPWFSEKYLEVENLLKLALHQNPNERPTTRGIRVLEPLRSLQNDLNSISSDDYFRLRPKHSRSSSGSFTLSHSSSLSSS